MIKLLCRRTLSCMKLSIALQTISRFGFLNHGFSAQAARLVYESLNYPNSSSTANPEFSSYSISISIQDCIVQGSFLKGQALHCQVLKKGNCLDSFAWNVLLNLYVKSELLSDALKVFNEIPERNVVSFVTLIQGYCMADKFIDGLTLFSRLHREGHELNAFVFTTILKLAVAMEWAELGYSVHNCVYKLGYCGDPFVGSALIDAYSVCGDVATARGVFDGILCKDMVTWTGVVACCAENNCFSEALELFNEMRIGGLMPNNYTFAAVLKACVGLNAIGVGKSVHSCAVKTCYENANYVGIALLDFYTECGDMQDAHQVFEGMPVKDVIPWSFMIARYAQNGLCQAALDIFCGMRQALVVPNQYALASALQACATSGNLNFGEQLHGFLLKIGLISNVFVSNALMDVYAKCELMESSMILFVDASHINDVSWNTMIVGYGQLGDADKALTMFMNMLEDKVLPTRVTYSSVLKACASLAALDLGMQLHSLTIKTKFDNDTVVGNALIDMYAKCGQIQDARSVFDMMRKHDDVSWNAMICGYSLHGLGKEALKVFENMKTSESNPSTLTFVGVLSACSNMGLLVEGEAYFASMVKDYGIEPCIEHFTCMVWLLGRLGKLDRAMKLIREMPFEPSVMMWRALLGACVIHYNIEVGKVAAEHVLEIEPHDESAYVLLSNIYASAKRWGNVAYVRKIMKKKGVKKEPGLSWIEIQGEFHYFSVGDTSHSDLKLIRAMLEWLKMITTRERYIANCDVILLDVEDDEKERLLWLHSERLALALGLVKMPSGCPIRILKNLRICADCHAVFKLISKFVQREIIVRDINRFHHFQHGLCSCGDYW